MNQSNALAFALLSALRIFDLLTHFTGKMLLSKIKLSMRFGRVTYVVSSVLSLVMTVFAVLSPQVIPLCIIIKLLSIPVIQYLVTNLSEGLVMYFYINLGISKKEYCLIPAAVDFGIFVLLMTASGIAGYALT